MKKMYSLIAMVVLMSGCSYKNEAIELPSYKTQYLSQTTQNQYSVSFLSVTDAREDKTSIGHVEANGQVTSKFYSNVDFAEKYKEGLTNALKSAKFNLSDNPAGADATIEVKIKDIQLVYNDTNKFDENLHGKIIIEVTLNKQGKKIEQTFTQKQGKWIKPSYSSKDIEPFLYTIFTDSINSIVAKLAAQ